MTTQPVPEQAAHLAVRLQHQFGGVGNARLPELYVQARNGLAQCVRVDECKEWSDKAEAIRSYARQAGDDELMRTAMRIKSRAVERLGSLLEQLEAAKNHHDLATRSDTLPSRAQARKEGGLSKHEAKQAQAVARFASKEPERFETMVERDKPATVTELAREGRKPAPKKPTAHLAGRTPKEFSLSVQAMGELGRMLQAAERVSPAVVAQVATAEDRARILGETRALIKWMADLHQRLRRPR